MFMSNANNTTKTKETYMDQILFSVSKNGVAAKDLERNLGVTYKTAHRMARQIRSLMNEEGGKISGYVEAETGVEPPSNW
jgi:transposase